MSASQAEHGGSIPLTCSTKKDTTYVVSFFVDSACLRPALFRRYFVPAAQNNTICPPPCSSFPDHARCAESQSCVSALWRFFDCEKISILTVFNTKNQLVRPGSPHLQKPFISVPACFVFSFLVLAEGRRSEYSPAGSLSHPEKEKQRHAPVRKFDLGKRTQISVPAVLLFHPV